MPASIWKTIIPLPAGEYKEDKGRSIKSKANYNRSENGFDIIAYRIHNKYHTGGGQNKFAGWNKCLIPVISIPKTKVRSEISQ
jgi:hypothetical protein